MDEINDSDSDGEDDDLDGDVRGDNADYGTAQRYSKSRDMHHSYNKIAWN